MLPFGCGRLTPAASSRSSDLDDHAPADDRHRVAPHTALRRTAQDRSVGEVEACAVRATADRVPVDRAVMERKPAMRTAIIEGEHLCSGAEDGESPAADLDRGAAAIGKTLELAEIELRHEEKHAIRGQAITR